MTPAQLIALMAMMQCHTMVVDVPERRETIVQTVCIKAQDQVTIPTPQATKPVATPKKVQCRKQWYFKKGHKRWRRICR